MYGQGTIVPSENRENASELNGVVKSFATHHSINKLVLSLILCDLPPFVEPGDKSRNQEHQSGNVRVIRDLTEDLSCGKDGGDHLRQVSTSNDEGVDTV